MSDLTLILDAVSRGETSAMAELLPLVYGELRAIACRKMANLGEGQTLQPTALVHEFWLRISGLEEPKFTCRKHFFAAAAEAMRHILIDSVRKKETQRRGCGERPVSLDDLDFALPTKADRLLAVDDALEKFAREWPKEAEVVKLRFYVGLTSEETAEILGVSTRTVENHWAFARTWLFDAINVEK